MIASLMMVTFNRLNLTTQTLTDLIRTTTYPFELIIVDNASQDGTVEFLETFCQQHAGADKFFKSYHIHKNTENQGIAIARNQCLKMATGEWLSTLDNDVLLPLVAQAKENARAHYELSQHLKAS